MYRECKSTNEVDKNTEVNKKDSRKKFIPVRDSRTVKVSELKHAEKEDSEDGGVDVGDKYNYNKPEHCHCHTPMKNSCQPELDIDVLMEEINDSISDLYDEVSDMRREMEDLRKTFTEMLLAQSETNNILKKHFK